MCGFVRSLNKGTTPSTTVEAKVTFSAACFGCSKIVSTEVLYPTVACMRLMLLLLEVRTCICAANRDVFGPGRWLGLGLLGFECKPDNMNMDRARALNNRRLHKILVWQSAQHVFHRRDCTMAVVLVVSNGGMVSTPAKLIASADHREECD